MRWIALFSQTGSELEMLCQALGRRPDQVYTNISDVSSMRYKGPYKQLSHSKIEKNLRETVSEGDMVTLHGYLRILSPDVCDLPCTILNGHPAPLHLAPDLKGKDPQDRIFEMKHPLGTVIHEVTSVVDDGEVLYYNDAVNDCDTVDDVYASQKILSFRLWLQCLQERL